jgi:hypothetical protein
MPQGDPNGRMHGFQLWANLPSHLKMSAPRYQDVQSKEVPEVTDDDGTNVRVVCGDFLGKERPGRRHRRRSALSRRVRPARKAKDAQGRVRASRVRVRVRGSGSFRDSSAPFSVLTEKDGRVETVERELTGNRSLVLFDRGDEVVVQADDEGIRLLLVSGKPIEEPVVWYGPIVMNTQAELRQAVNKPNNGTFIK